MGSVPDQSHPHEPDSNTHSHNEFRPDIIVSRADAVTCANELRHDLFILWDRLRWILLVHEGKIRKRWQKVRESMCKTEGKLPHFRLFSEPRKREGTCSVQCSPTFQSTMLPISAYFVPKKSELGSRRLCKIHGRS
jgi:hypothetical protein